MMHNDVEHFELEKNEDEEITVDDRFEFLGIGIVFALIALAILFLYIIGERFTVALEDELGLGNVFLILGGISAYGFTKYNKLNKQLLSNTGNSEKTLDV